MKVSVIIPVFNVEKYLAEAIESALNQTYKDIEIIAINDGSTDASLQVLESFRGRIRILTQENKGVSMALNYGLNFASGELIAFLDGDDIWKEDKLEKQINEFEKNPALEATFGKIEQFLSPELSDNTLKFQFHKGDMSFKSKLTILIRKESFKKYGSFFNLRLHDFIAWFDHAESKGIVYNMTNDLVVYRRIRENSLSQSPEYYPELLRYLKEKIRNKKVTA